MSKFRNIAFVASEMKEAQAARRDLVARYGDTAPEQADVIVSDWLWVGRERTLGDDLVFYPYSSALGAVMVPVTASL